MASRDDEKKFQTTGRQPDGNWMDLHHGRPTWMGKESRNTVDSGRESMESRFASLPSGQEDGSVTRMTIRHDERMQTSRRVQATRSGMAHIRGYCLNRKIQRVRYQGARPKRPDQNGPRMMCAQTRLVTKDRSTTEIVRDYVY